jgi:hypothetical protein
MMLLILHSVLSRRVRQALFFAGALSVALWAGGCATAKSSAEGISPVPHAARATLRNAWGIEVTGLRMSGNGHLIDFRYRVLDPDKAGMLADPRYKPILIDQATGIRMKIPDTPKLGPLRQSAKRLQTGKIYFMMFANHGLTVKSGSNVTVLIGDFKAENLTVQ